jgi:hypothetical protein
LPDLATLITVLPALIRHLVNVLSEIICPESLVATY